MASIINASTSGAGGVITTADSSGVLQLQTGGTTAISISAAQAVTLTNALPATSGGTGLTSVGSAGNVLTSDGTNWTSVPGGVTSLNGQTGAITNTSLYAIGGYVTGRPADLVNYTVNTTIAGSSLYSTSTVSPMYTTGWSAAAGQSLVSVGTWRCVSAAFGNGSAAGYAGLWVRIS